MQDSDNGFPWSELLLTVLLLGALAIVTFGGR